MLNSLAPVNIESAEILLRLCNFPHLEVVLNPSYDKPEDRYVALESGVALTDEDGSWDDPNVASLAVLAVNMLPSLIGFWRKMHSLEPLADEMARARRKFPLGTHLFEALGEEFGELAREFDVKHVSMVTRADMEAEARQVACVAMRIAEEGTAIPDKRVLEFAKGLELLCREIQGRGGAS